MPFSDKRRAFLTSIFYFPALISHFSALNLYFSALIPYFLHYFFYFLHIFFSFGAPKNSGGKEDPLMFSLTESTSSTEVYVESHRIKPQGSNFAQKNPRRASVANIPQGKTARAKYSSRKNRVGRISVIPWR